MTGDSDILVRIATHARESKRAFTLRVNAAGEWDAIWTSSKVDLPRDCNPFVTTDADMVTAINDSLEGEHIPY
jgi:hypothetical protein